MFWRECSWSVAFAWVYEAYHPDLTACYLDHLCCQIHEELPNCSRIIKTEHLCMRPGHCMELDMMLKDGIISITIQHACNQHVGIFHTSILTPQVVSWGFTAGGSALGWTLVYWYLSSQMWHCMRIFPQKVNKMGKSDSSYFRDFPSRCFFLCCYQA